MYMLDETGSIKPRSKPLCRTLAISAVRSAPGYGSSRMVYTRDAHRIEYFAYHKWADSPASMLYTLMVNGLERSGRFQMVLPANAREGGPRLDTELLMLRQRFADGESLLELSVRARLFANEQILATRVFQIAEEAGGGPESGVDAANRATARLVEGIVVWMDEVLGKRPSVCAP
jgi:cholesterol transport system auxiliary component